MQNRDIEQIKSLADHIAPQIGLPTRGYIGPVDQQLANFAIKRHRVGSILHMATKQSSSVDSVTASTLESAFYDNIRGNLAQKATLHNLTRLFEQNAIPFSVLKGLGLADQIYFDPNIRQSKDIDILISPTSSESAIQLLGSSGFVYKSHSLNPKKPVTLKQQLYEMHLFKDLIFQNPKFSTIVELHQRLLRMEPENLTVNFNAATRFQPIPSINNTYYCLYIILHGAVSLWHRLKWVVDISLLVRRMDVSQRYSLMVLAKKNDCEAIIIASLEFVNEIFPDSLDCPSSYKMRQI